MDHSLFQFIERYSREILENTFTTGTEKVTELVWRSAVRLLDELEPNLYEDKTYRRLLDFGHTFSPYIESESGFHISHGMAVSIDIAVSAGIAFELGLVSARERDRILSLLVNSRLPTYSSLLTADGCQRALAETEAHRGGHLNLVVPNGIGSAMFVGDKERLTSQVLHRALDFLRRENGQPTFAVSVPVVEPVSTAEITRIHKTGSAQLPFLASGASS
jgi:3-dehydroquinate synthase